MPRLVALALVPLAGCWTAENRDDRKVNALATELANNRARVEKIDRRLTAFEHERDERAALEAKIDALEKKLAAITAAATTSLATTTPLHARSHEVVRGSAR
jgi:outer membrane murein-binding lipoprotein Lpp